ncbi:DegT/DnrJ/EryC1/StrS family aminotransferase [Acidovorax kalamii]|uniref:DegT/DnrJ/EryC1/StrS family aminotransferase n=1 Tax=Acidovorax kalamii TaxID=2004485 RepID=UPI002091D461|nr:DegT/DnrJ/EryC1/StrS family aminotransferase [Acidovorax kalamii]MCO5354360.1 DegT/DnrJ/EryC1/StrS family aminotransferase [Acidovorax kalamii]
MNNSLALLGGPAIIRQTIKSFNTIGEEELAAVTEVMRSGVLSAYIGARGDAFMGGPRVRAFEKHAAEHFGVKHAIAVNSWTSGLIAAIGAIGLEPGDEVITTPWTMVATATAILHWNGIPVFADIDPTSFNIDPASVEKLIGPRTRAILAVDIFGQSCDMRALRDIATRHGLKLLCDTAQAPGATYHGSMTGTLADIGGFSLNYHKHIHCGEGGILVTNDDRYARRLQLIRNHAEAVVDSDEPAELCNMLGYNFRLGEIEAAIATEQLKKLAANVQGRQRVVDGFNAGLGKLPGINTPRVSDGCTHVYYVYGMRLDIDRLGVPRDRLVAALRAEGVPGLMNGYQNVHLYPLFQQRIAYGTKGFPWTSPYADRDVHYGRGTCPVAEDLHARTFLGINICLNDYSPDDIAQVVGAFDKVWRNLDVLAHLP